MKKWNRQILTVLFGVLCGLVTGCGGLRFAGSPVFGREQMVFLCDQEPDEGIEVAQEEKPVPEEPSQAQDPLEELLVDINTAGVEELTTLKGIGQTRAQAIVAYREEHGPFAQPEDLMQVPGIKEGIYSKLESQIKVR